MAGLKWRDGYLSSAALSLGKGKVDQMILSILIHFALFIPYLILVKIASEALGLPQVYHKSTL